MAGLVIGALFILPFLLFSATSGQLTDKYDKTAMIRFVKSLEIAIMALAALGFVTRHVPLLLGCVFLMGLHSTLFGPVKFAYLPQHLSERELTGGNGMVEMGTFVAILLGNVAGGVLIALPGIGADGGRRRLPRRWPWPGASRRSSCRPRRPPTRASSSTGTRSARPGATCRLAHGNIVVFRSLLGISWMWFFGAVFLSNFPSFAKDVLHGDEHVASLLLVVFSVGIGIGSLLCEMLSRRHVEIGLVPLGAIGMSVFAIDLYFASRGLPAAAPQGLGTFVAQPAHWRVMADLALLSLFAGLYSVPMYALIQLRSQPTHRARIIAANNILNALFMIASSLLAGALLGAGFTVPQIFLFTGLANAVVAFYIFLLVPEYLLRFIALRRLAQRLPASHRRRRAHARHGRGHPGLQPRQLRRCGAADGGQPAADPLHHGPPHLSRAGAGLAVQAGQGHPDRAANAKTRRPTSRRSPRRAACSTTATCCASSPKAASRATAGCRSSRAAS